MTECSESRNEIILVSLGIVSMLFEYWLGKTNRTKACSTLELVIMAVKSIFFKGEQNGNRK